MEFLGIAIFIIIIALLVAIFIIIRSICLWYLRINDRIELLEKQYMTMKEMNANLSQVISILSGDAFHPLHQSLDKPE